MDNVLNSLGWFGRYQMTQFILLFLPVWDCAFCVMSFIFIGRNFDYTCAKANDNHSEFGAIFYDDDASYTDYGVNVSYRSCKIVASNGTDDIYSGPCRHGFEYDQPADRSFIAEWNLVCEKEAMAETTQTVMFLGMMLGASMCSALADKYGRKLVYVVSHMLFLVISVAQAFAPNYMAFVVMRFLFGVVQQGIGLVSCVMLLELLPAERRAITSQLGSFVWPAGLLALALICFLCRDLTWRNTQLALSVWSFYAVFLWWLVDESLRWLTANNKTEEAEKILRKAARTNNVDEEYILQLYHKEIQALIKPKRCNQSSPPSCRKSLQLVVDLEIDPKPSEVIKQSLTETSLSKTEPNIILSDVSMLETEPSYSAFWKNRQVFLLTAIACFMWFTDSLSYYGLLMIPSSFHDDLYIGFSLNVLVEIPAAVAMLFLINRIGRRYCMIVAHLLGGISLLAAVILSNIPNSAEIAGLATMTLIVSLLGKFGISLGFGVLWLYTPELFPTNIRSTAFGIASVAARVGGMIAPYSRTISRHIPWLPGVMFGTCCLCIPVLMRFLPETQGCELPQTIADMRFGSDSVSRKGNKKLKNTIT